MKLTLKTYIAIATAILTPALLQAAPKDVVDFTNWKLTLPVNSSGGTSGTAAEISASSLKGGYSNSNFFYSNSANSWIVFKAPVNGAKTSSSASGPRTELRHQPSAGSDSYFNLTSGYNRLYCKVKVRDVPDNNSGKLVIGQIHGRTDKPPLKLQVRRSGSKLRASVIWNDSPTGSNTSIDITNSSTDLEYGKLYKYYIECDSDSGGRYIEVWMKKGSVEIARNKQYIGGSVLSSSWNNQDAYFKAGVYNQTDSSTGSSDFSRANFHLIKLTD